MNEVAEQEVCVIPDPQVIAALRTQLTRLTELQARIEARSAHPPLISTSSWAGPSAEAHTRASVEIRHRLRVAGEAVGLALEATRDELARAGG